MADVDKLAVGREDDYTRELATDHEAYLSGHGESPAPAPPHPTRKAEHQSGFRPWSKSPPHQKGLGRIVRS